MNFSRKHVLGRIQNRLKLAIVLVLAMAGCHRQMSKQQKALRTEVGNALAERSYTKAADLARQLIQLNPQDNGSWDRLVQAQFGLQDHAALKQTLEQWQQTVKKPSSKLDDYNGDLAFAEGDAVSATQAWQRVLHAQRKNIRVLEKVARAERAQQHWAWEEASWTSYIALSDGAYPRIQRALCRRRLHRWEDAFEDLKRARELSPNDPEVQRVGKLFEQMDKFLPEVRELDAALAVSPNDSGLLTDRALIFLRSQDYELALEDSEHATRVGPWAVRPKLFQAIALLQLGRPTECDALRVQRLIRLETLSTEFLETISRLDSEISVERSNAELYTTRAWQLNEIKQPALALQDAENAARLNPKSAGAFAEWGYALVKLGRAEEALQQIMHATELDTNSATAWQYRGELEMERGETLEAIESLSHAIDTNRTVTALQKREACYRRLGLFIKAEQDRRALEELNAQGTK